MLGDGSQLVGEEEGPSSPTVYQVGGLWHIARGCVVDPSVSGAGLSAAARAFIDSETLTRARQRATVIPGWLGLSSVRQEVLVSMCYQLGELHDWIGFRQALALGEYNIAADQMLYRNPPGDMTPSIWHVQTPARCEREARMMRANQWVPKV